MHVLQQGREDRYGIFLLLIYLMYMFYLQLSTMQEEMEKMKEENKMLRLVVDQTVRDYNDLQTKLAAYQKQPADEPKVITIITQY
jgi:hypothetical protein